MGVGPTIYSLFLLLKRKRDVAHKVVLITALGDEGKNTLNTPGGWRPTLDAALEPTTLHQMEP